MSGERVIYRSLVDLRDVSRIGTLLRSADVLVPAFAVDDTVLYSPGSYIADRVIHATQSSLLVDRNIFTRWLDLAEPRRPNRHHRIAAGLMAFAQCGQIAIEPNVPLYELAFSASNAAAQEELRLFRRLEKVHPVVWADLALGRRDDLGRLAETDEIEAEADFDRPLRKWWANYIVLLRIAGLELRSDLRPLERVLALLEWMYRDFLFSAPSLALALHYFCPGVPRAGLLKGLRSPDRERAIAGIQNATWDLLLLSHWVDMSRRQKSVVLLATRDEWARRIARSYTVADPGETTDGHLEQIVGDLWGPADASTILDAYESYTARVEASDRAKTRANYDAARLVAESEGAVRSWREAGGHSAGLNLTRFARPSDGFSSGPTPKLPGSTASLVPQPRGGLHEHVSTRRGLGPKPSFRAQ